MAEAILPPSTILVTGGTGLVGAYIIRDLIQLGYRVKATRRKAALPAFMDPDLHDKTEWIGADVLDPAGLEEAMEDVDAVIHAAGLVSFHHKDKQQLFHINTEGTANVVNASIEKKIRKLIYVSSVAAIGKDAKGGMVSEENKWTESKYKTNYALSKHLGEMEVWRGIAEGLPGVIVNPTTILGYGDWNTTSNRFFKNGYGGFSWYPEGATGFVDVEDVSAAITKLLASEIHSERFILNGANWSYRQVLDAIADGFNKKRPHRKATPLLGKIAWRMDQLGAWITGKKPFLTKESARVSQSNTRFDNSKLLRAFPDFQFTDLNDTIKKACARYMKNITLILLSVFFGAAAFSQQKTFLVGGKVIDSATMQPLNGASVFAQNTTQGTTCKEDGSFVLRLPNGGYDLVISYTGYDTRSIRISNTSPVGDSIVVALPQIDQSLAAVAVVATNEVADGWQRFGKFFFDNFIGTTPNAAFCEIQNHDSLHFYYTKNKKRNRLKVTSSSDLLVRNNALGYLIRYQLDSFSYDYNTNISQYTGYPFFIELDTTEQVKEEWKKNRARSYLGSRLHFMSALYDSIVTDEGFTVEKMEANLKTATGRFVDNLYDSSTYKADSNTVEVNWDGRYRVSYKNVLPDKKFLEEFKLPANSRMQVTLLDINGGFVVEQNGFFYEQYDVINTGYWGWKKLAESLPYDYEYE